MTTTRDLILRAEQYANKENASFYSYAEKVAMLNESYVSLNSFLYIIAHRINFCKH